VSGAVTPEVIYRVSGAETPDERVQIKAGHLQIV
jgi:hypothetical protein